MSIREAVIRHAALCREALAAGKPRPQWEGGSLSGAFLNSTFLSGAYLYGAYLYGAYLIGAYLRGAYLSSADLSGADLSGADLSSAILTGADLSGAYLSGADLIGADLSDAILTGADLTSAVLDGAKIRGAKGIVSAGPVGVEGRTIYGVAGLNGTPPMFQAGCFWGTADELRAAITARYADGSGIERLRAGYLAALDFIVAALAAQEAT